MSSLGIYQSSQINNQTELPIPKISRGVHRVKNFFKTQNLNELRTVLRKFLNSYCEKITKEGLISKVPNESEQSRRDDEILIKQSEFKF